MTVEDEPIAQPKVDTKPIENLQVEEEDTMDTSINLIMDYFRKLPLDSQTKSVYHL